MKKIFLIMIIASALFSFTKNLDSIPKSMAISFDKGIVLVGYKNQDIWYGLINKMGKLSIDKELNIKGKLLKIKKLKDGFIAIGNTSKKNAIVIKFDKNMNEVWKKTFNNSKDDKISSITLLNNNFFILGETLTNKFKKDIWILKLDQNGNTLTKPLILGTKFNDKASDITTDGKNIFVTGYTNFKPFIIKLNSNLIKLNSKFLNIKAITINIFSSNKNILIDGVVKNNGYLNIFTYKSDKNLSSNNITQIYTSKSEALFNSKLINNQIILTGYDKVNHSKKAIIMKIEGNYIAWKILVKPNKNVIPYSILKTPRGIAIAGRIKDNGFFYFIKDGKNID